jgi:large subunit ribosomal protein L7/L12
VQVQQNLGVVKVVKDLTGLGLKEAKDLVDAAPGNVKENVDKATADDIAGKLKEAGADVEII